VAIVWVIQIALNLFQNRLNPNSVAAAQLTLYDGAQKLRDFLSPGIALSLLLTCLFLAMVVRGNWPLSALSLVRRVANNVLILVGSLTLFTFVTTEVAEGRIRAALAQDLRELAQLRRERATLQWIATAAARESRSGDEEVSAWRAQYAGASYCGPDDCPLAQTALAPTIPRRPEPVSDWLWLGDFNSIVFENPLAQATPTGEADDCTRKTTPKCLLPDEHDLGYLYRLQMRAEDELGSEARARDAVRNVAIEALASLLGPELAGTANDFLDSLKASVLEVLTEYVEHSAEKGYQIVSLPALFKRPDLPQEQSTESQQAASTPPSTTASTEPEVAQTAAEQAQTSPSANDGDATSTQVVEHTQTPTRISSLPPQPIAPIVVDTRVQPVVIMPRPIEPVRTPVIPR
jgi:hypothetical protein